MAEFTELSESDLSVVAGGEDVQDRLLRCIPLPEAITPGPVSFVGVPAE